MRQTQFDRIVIISAEISDLSYTENGKRTYNLDNCLDELNFDYSMALSVYENTIETSFVVRVNDETEYCLLKDLAIKSFGQKCILHRDKQGQAYLHYNDKIDSIGVLKQVSEDKARKNYHGFTILNDNYFIAE